MTEEVDAPATRASGAAACGRRPLDLPSLEGYTIAELRTQQLARLIRLDELRPERLARPIKTLTRGG